MKMALLDHCMYFNMEKDGMLGWILAIQGKKLEWRL
jgi:hypothetical protein